VREHAKLHTERGQALGLVETETGPFERVADVFVDGTVQVVSTFGHTPGSIGIYVVLPDGRRLFFAGDTINRVRELSPPQSKTRAMAVADVDPRSEEHTSELQSRENLVCRLLLENKKTTPSRK